MLRTGQTFDSGSVKVANPDADSGFLREANRPGVSMALGGSGLPGNGWYVQREVPGLRQVGSAKLGQRVGSEVDSLSGEKTLSRPRAAIQNTESAMEPTLRQGGIQVGQIEEPNLPSSQHQRKAILV